MICQAHYRFSLPQDSSKKAFHGEPVPKICGAERPEKGRDSQNPKNEIFLAYTHFPFHSEKGSVQAHEMADSSKLSVSSYDEDFHSDSSTQEEEKSIPFLR